MVFTQIEAILNSRLVVLTKTPDYDGISAFTPEHFLIEKMSLT